MSNGGGPGTQTEERRRWVEETPPNVHGVEEVE